MVIKDLSDLFIEGFELHSIVILQLIYLLKKISLEFHNNRSIVIKQLE